MNNMRIMGVWIDAGRGPVVIAPLDTTPRSSVNLRDSVSQTKGVSLSPIVSGMGGKGTELA